MRTSKFFLFFIVAFVFISIDLTAQSNTNEDSLPINEGKLMYPAISSYEKKNMDDFIESFHTLFEEEAKKRK